jgi:flagellar assembly factor FliW
VPGTLLAQSRDGMKILSRKFNAVLEVEAESVIRFPHGIIGFSDEKEFVLLERDQSPKIAWLQSVKDPDLAFPVVSSHDLAAPYPDVPLADAVYSDRLDAIDEDSAVLVVLTCQRGMNPTVNMTAPIVVNARTRCGTQVILQGSRFASRELLELRSDIGPPPGSPAEAPAGAIGEASP